MYHNGRPMFTRRSLPLTLAPLFALAASAFAAASADWQLVQIHGRDFLTVDNIAKFYNLPNKATPADKRVRFDNGKNCLEFELDSREVMINGVRNWLCFPITEQNGQYLVSRIDLAKTIEPQLRPQMIT